MYPTYTCKLNLWINESTGYHISREKKSNWINLQIHNLKFIIWYISNFVRNLFSLDATLNTLFNCSFGNRSIWHRTQIHFHLRSFTPQIKVVVSKFLLIWFISDRISLNYMPWSNPIKHYREKSDICQKYMYHSAKKAYWSPIFVLSLG